MSKPDYTEFDNAILAQIAAGRDKMSKLDSISSGLRPLSEPFKASDNYGNSTPTFRVIDRRLQALRKKGKIAWDGMVWYVKETA